MSFYCQFGCIDPIYCEHVLTRHDSLSCPTTLLMSETFPSTNCQTIPNRTSGSSDYDSWRNSSYTPGSSKESQDIDEYIPGSNPSNVLSFSDGSSINSESCGNNNRLYEEYETDEIGIETNQCLFQDNEGTSDGNVRRLRRGLSNESTDSRGGSNECSSARSDTSDKSRRRIEVIRDPLELKAKGILHDIDDPDRRFTAYKLLVTFPQNDTKKETILTRIQENFKSQTIKLIIVCEEFHSADDTIAKEDVGVHLHVLIAFSSGARHTRKMWDTIGGGKGVNLARIGGTMKDLYQTVAYVCKDGNYICDPPGGEEQYLHMAKIVKAAKIGKFDVVAQMVRDGISLSEIDAKFPGFVLQHHDKIQSYKALLSSLKQSNQQLMPFTRNFFIEDVSPYYELVEWFDKNFWNKPWEERPIREPNFWLKGSIMIGKSTMFAKLIKHLRIFVHPLESAGWCDLYEDEKYDLIIFDEFKGGIRIQDFNKWCDGAPFAVPRRKLAPIMKMKNIPVLVLSNFAPDACWPNVYAHDKISIQACASRFKVVNYECGIGSLAKILN